MNKLFYDTIIKRMLYLEKIEYNLELKFIDIVLNYQDKYNKSIFKK